MEVWSRYGVKWDERDRIVYPSKVECAAVLYTRLPPLDRRSAPADGKKGTRGGDDDDGGGGDDGERGMKKLSLPTLDGKKRSGKKRGGKKRGGKKRGGRSATKVATLPKATQVAEVAGKEGSKADDEEEKSSSPSTVESIAVGCCGQKK